MEIGQARDKLQWFRGSRLLDVPSGRTRDVPRFLRFYNPFSLLSRVFSLEGGEYQVTATIGNDWPPAGSSHRLEPRTIAAQPTRGPRLRCRDGPACPNTAISPGVLGPPTPGPLRSIANWYVLGAILVPDRCF